MHHALILLFEVHARWLKDAFGYVASALVLCTFSVRSMRVLRCLGIASNVSFILYATVTGMVPILVLHSLLLPMNVYRLVQIVRAPSGGVA
jgi:CRP/FNR family cyclic AMP-dependent transcriptional regulator